MCVCNTPVPIFVTCPEIRKHIFSQNRSIDKGVKYLASILGGHLNLYIILKSVKQLFLDSNSFVLKRVKTNLSRLSFKASNACFNNVFGFFSLCCKSTYVMQYVVSNGEITEITRIRFSSRLHNFHQIVIKLCVCWLISRALFALNTSESGLGSVWPLTWWER